MRCCHVRGFFIFALFISGLQPIIAQTTFAKRLALKHTNFVARAVTVYGDQYYVSGIAYGNDPYVYNGTQSLVLNRLGEIADSILIAPSDQRVEAWGRENLIIGDTLYFSGDVYLQGRNVLFGYFLGDSTNSRRTMYQGPVNPDTDSGFTNAFGALNYNNKIVVYGSETNPESLVNGLNGLLLMFDQDLNHLDTIRFDNTPEFTQSVRSFNKFDQNHSIVVITQSNRERCEPNIKYALLKLDENFTTVDRYDVPEDENWFVRSDAFVQENGGIYVQTDSLIYDNFPLGPTDCISTKLYDGRITKFDRNLNLVWSRDFKRPNTSPFIIPDNAGIVQAQEPDQLVAAASYWSGEGGSVLANLVKFDTLGNEIWNRTYGFYDTTENDVIVYDVKADPDGGYVLVGEVRVDQNAVNDSLGRLPSQQAWIMKVDEDGCLIPGCGEVVVSSDEPELQKRETQLLLYPNPVENLLSFLLPGNGGVIRTKTIVYDSQGRIVRRLPERDLISGVTYNIDLEALESGIYYLSVILVDGRRKTLPFIKR